MKLRAKSLTCGFLALFWLVQAAPATDEAPRGTVKTTFLVLYRPGPAWLPGKPVAEQPTKEHGRYLLSLFAKGTLKSAGPFMDDGGGAAIFEAESETALRALVAEDPGVKSGLFQPEIHPWSLVDWAQYLKK
jgi:uncharacterized protein